MEKDEQWKTMLDKQVSDKLNDVKVNVVTSDARKAAESKFIQLCLRHKRKVSTQ